MKNISNKIWSSRFWWLFLLIIIAAINFIASSFHYRFDLTKEKRYTLSKATKELLKNLDEPVEIDVFLKGDFPAGFKKLANGVNELLWDFKEYSGGRLKVNFIDPFRLINESAEHFLKETFNQIKSDSNSILNDTSGSFNSRLKLAILNERGDKNVTEKNVLEAFTNYFIDSLAYNFDVFPFTLQAPGKVGDEQIKKEVLPGAIIHYRDTSVGINLLKGTKSYGTEPDQLAALYNDVEATLEYKFANAIQKITSQKKPLIGYALGHGEAWGYTVNDAVRTLIKDYNFDTVNVSSYPYIPSAFDALIVLKPTLPFSDTDKFKLDQYQMRGGKILWFVDNMYDGFDSLYNEEGFITYDRGLNLEDIFFRYGVRLNQALLQDMQCDKLPQISGNNGQGQQQRLVDWPVFPILNGSNHPISKNLDGIRTMFPGTIDTVKADGIKKTILLSSSNNAKTIRPPEKIKFDFLQIAPDAKLFKESNLPVAVLLEGKFRSFYANRVSKTVMDTLEAYKVPFRNESNEDGKMIVVADGDIATNQVSQKDGPLPMGVNLFTRIPFANHDFYLNSIEYLVNPSGILETRSKDFTLRLLDPKKVKNEKALWQIINTALPVLLVLIFGFIYQLLRKKKYSV